MAITPQWFGLGMKAVMAGSVDLDTDTFKLTLHTSTYSPNVDTHDFFDDATNELSTANGYTAGGVTLGTLALNYDATSHQVRWDFADPSWTFTGAVTWRYGVIRKARGGAASADELVCYLDWGSSQTVSSPYTLTIDANGLLYVDVL
jgi:hypothetical protein